VIDERLRELERQAASGDEGAKARLRVEQTRIGLRIPFPPRRKARTSDRSGYGFPGWCPVCETWNLWRRRQKERSLRGRHGHRAGPELAGTKRALPTRFCRGPALASTESARPAPAPPAPPRTIRFTVPSEADLRGEVEIVEIPVRPTQRPRREPINLVDAEEFQVEVAFPTAEAIRDVRMATEIQGVMIRRLCQGPAKGQPCRPPLHVLEARLSEVTRSHGCISDDEVDWLRHRIARERRRLGPGVHEGFAVVQPCGHPASRVDYFDDERRLVRCKDCQVVLDPETGRVVR